jgi:hypothetical protein
MFSARNKEEIKSLPDCLKHKKRRKGEKNYLSGAGARLVTVLMLHSVICA